LLFYRHLSEIEPGPCGLFRALKTTQECPGSVAIAIKHPLAGNIFEKPDRIHDMNDRIITRPDFDGVVCAVLLKEALGDDLPILWTQPNEMQKGDIRVGERDIVANLPITGPCALWFDHHVSNKIEGGPPGLFRVAPSAAGLVYEYYQDIIDRRFQILVQQADKIDAAQLELNEILHPEHYPYILLSMTISADTPDDSAYCDHLVTLLRSNAIEQVITDPQVAQRCQRAKVENIAYKTHLENYTRVQGSVSITDFRSMDPAPNGNRFLVYSLFPQTVVNVKTFNEGNTTAIKIGHSIINCNCKVNVGHLLSQYGGGGHRGAGACRIPKNRADAYLKKIVALLVQNQPND
jgi:oligoribonuclease NrnB/cAMP/cGMP phosphodiesterase (DHH superfamily)